MVKINQKSYFGQFEACKLNGGVRAVHGLVVSKVLIVDSRGLSSSFFLVDGGQEDALPLIFLVVLLPLEQLSLDLDHLFLQELNELAMLRILLLLLRVERPLLLLISCHLQLLQFPLLLREDMVIILILKLELIELLNTMLDDRLLFLDPLI